MPLRDLWPPFPAARILHDDPDLLVIDKPVGMSTHAPAEGKKGDAHERLLELLASRGEKDPYLGIHQRLDRDTSGVLLFTRQKSANRPMAEQFEGRKVEKTYVAAVVGLPERHDTGLLEHKLVPTEGGVMRALSPRAPGGQLAITRYRVLRRQGKRALVELTPETGRTHQLRAQLAAKGSPIAGDDLYGGQSEAAGGPLPRLLLHAQALTVRHPSTGKKITFRAAVPPAFDAWLRGEASAPFASVDAIERALRDAADARYDLAHDPATTAFRIACGAGDGLPGVDVDVYGEHLVVSLSGDEAEQAREAVLDAAARLGAAGVYVKVRPKDASRAVDTRRDDLAPREAVRGESAPASFTILEQGLPFEVRLGDGLSTGIFLDQRENRRRVRELAQGASVLNLFAYTGAFTVAAAAGGARKSVTVDVSRGALDWARKNLEAVGADPAAHALVEADALVWLRVQKAGRDRFDLVILDPPSFATTKKSRFSADSDYRGVAALALGLLAPGGRLLACTNHRGIVRAKLRRYLHEAARDAGRAVAQMKDLPDPSDFPPLPGREPHLKSVLVTLKGA